MTTSKKFIIAAIVGALLLVAALVVVGFNQISKLGPGATPLALERPITPQRPTALVSKPTAVVEPTHTPQPTQVVAVTQAVPAATLAPTSTPFVMEPATALFYDDFADPTSGWAPFFIDAAGTVNSYSAESYRLHAVVPNQPIYDVHVGGDVTPRQFSVEIDLQGDGSGGLLLGVQGDPQQYGRMSYYSAALTTDGRITLSRKQSGVASETTIAAAPIPAGTPRTGQPIRFRVAIEQDGIRIYLDDSEALFAPGVPVPAGGYGLFAVARSQPVRASFDNLLVTAHTKAAGPLCAALRRIVNDPHQAPLLTGVDIRIIQQRLTHLGYYEGDNQGTLTAPTIAAVEQFKQQNSLNEDGIGTLTWCRLLSSDAIFANNDQQERKVMLQRYRPATFDSAAALGEPMLLSVRQTDKTWRLALALPGEPLPFYIDVGSNVYDPALSPDGHWLAYTVTHGETTSIELIDSVSGERRKISTPELSAQFPVWSPDSHQLMYTADPGPKQPLAARNYIYDVRTGTQSQWSDQHTGWTDWSINGELVFTRWTGKSFDLFRARSDGSDLVNLTNTDDRDEDIPAWSVDGTQIAFTAYPRGQTQQRQLFVMLRDGSGLRQLVAIPGASSNPIWLADGRSIAFANQPSEDTWQPWLVASNGSNARQLSQNSDRIWFLGRIDRH